jgi:hypothetical protein
MANETVGDYVVVLAKCEASGIEKWAFIDTDKCLKLPIFKIGLLTNHPIIQAAKSGVKTFSDLKNIELSFELSGKDCNVKIYQTIMKFEKVSSALSGITDKIKWYNPIQAITFGRMDELSFQIIETIMTVGQKTKPGQDQTFNF